MMVMEVGERYRGVSGLNVQMEPDESSISGAGAETNICSSMFWVLEQNYQSITSMKTITED